jgi:hypothetical protein
MDSPLFHLDLLTGHEPALAPERELSQLAALRQATRLGRFSARANIRAAVWDKPRSSLRRPEERDSWEAPCSFVTCPPPMNRVLGAPVSDPARSCGLTPTRRVRDRRSGVRGRGNAACGSTDYP